MIALLKTAERTSHASFINNYVFQRHVFAYKMVAHHLLAGRRVLELGCGEGYGMMMLSPATDTYIGLDKHSPSQEGLPEQASFRQCQLPYLQHIESNSFDTVICFQVIEHIKNDHALLAEARRVLKPGGTLLLTTPNKLTSLTRNPFHIREYRPSEMMALVRQHFPISSVQGVYGNDRVMEYYEENKQSVNNMMRFDIFDLQHRLPAALLKMPYNLMNNINRWRLLRKIEDTTASIRYDDFFLDEVRNDCLDYFVTATA
ncbi:class I SAM-dependent methyltransferase [Chitinophaga vietnamensis]|uniref:class I SAM-dependent methyltransferase n=1 Tax=Chitinophaga vietnamensis TaxID=2593957 RepID=UPI0011780159|nr:class I SAM-dependent methyltransferase [Chitinophaga vietnamensis]